ncbi:hypothetical protein N7449_004652 [Penicillium cf. viridicatum]|uniref:HNH nuclease domain-containing protein n=1 Tax=Penicillium cf. viridicatum TaxID=2972119 RepID=A0A9W9MJS8_9EURO|nr:hypothetical protein N7449_004652 [Penicillium cf. viridicatum]
MTPIRDDQHILSEFDDPRRKELIEYLANRYPAHSLVNRKNFFAFWFADIGVLRFLADTRVNRKEEVIRALTNNTLLNVPSLLAGRLQVPKRVENETEDAGKGPSGGDSGKTPVQGASGVKTRESKLPLASKKRTSSDMESSASAPGTNKSEARKAQKSNKQRPTLNQVKPAVAVRDERRCQLTRCGEMGCEVAHIIPSKVDGNVLEQHHFDDIWNWLKAFWGEKKVSKWQELIAEGSEMSVHQVHNLITLDMKIHHFWDHGLVALRPVSRNKDETEMQIAFHWLPLKERFKGRSPNDGVRVNAHPLKDPRFRPVETPGDNYYIAVHREDGSVNLVTSGDIFTLKTTDKKERPLPSFDLLELRWHLSRIAVMQGGGEDDDIGDEPDDGHPFGAPSGSRSPDKLQSPARERSPAIEGPPAEEFSSFWDWSSRPRIEQKSFENMPIRTRRAQSLSPSKLRQTTLQGDISSLIEEGEE